MRGQIEKNTKPIFLLEIVNLEVIPMKTIDYLKLFCVVLNALISPTGRCRKRIGGHGMHPVIDRHTTNTTANAGAPESQIILLHLRKEARLTTTEVAMISVQKS